MGLSPEELRDHLLTIRDKHGALTRQAVVNEARDAKHPLHSKFNWDDSDAAERYRLIQAGELIRTFKVVYREDDREKHAVNGFVSVPATAGLPRRYEPVEEVMANPLQAQLLLQQALREAHAFRRKYAHLAEYAQLLQVLDGGDEAGEQQTG
jgi:hypothetical protein